MEKPLEWLEVDWGYPQTNELFRLMNYLNLARLAATKLDEDRNYRSMAHSKDNKGTARSKGHSKRTPTWSGFEGETGSGGWSLMCGDFEDIFLIVLTEAMEIHGFPGWEMRWENEVGNEVGNEVQMVDFLHLNILNDFTEGCHWIFELLKCA